ncbi:MAG: SOS response-associated peptidase [Clostridiaceae bacterium]|nr:SOS response-associated peptidase [Clostridiaceae bacterium]
MCGRYQLDTGIEQLMLRFDAENRYIGYGSKNEIFPTDMVAIITEEGGHNYIDAAKWGFDNPYDKRPLINARGETVDQKRTFKDMFTNGRCIIPATAFFEWQKNEEKKKTKMLITVKDVPIFGMAGIYRNVLNEDGSKIFRAAIITISANKVMSEIHDRMPVILPADAEKVWLDNTITDALMLKEFLKSFDGDMLYRPAV